MTSDGKVVVITGASSGIGQAVAVAFARQGSKLVLSGRDQARLTEAKRLVENEGSQARIVPADLSGPEGTQALIDDLLTAGDSIAAFVHVAGIWHDNDTVLAGIDYQDFSQKAVLDTYMVGLVAPALLVRAILPLVSKGSSLLAISGTFESGAKGWLPYYGSKRGLEDLWIGLADELKDKDIRVYCVSPSDTATDAYRKHFPEYIEESVAPEVVAEQVMHLATAEPAPKDVVWVVKKGHKPSPGFHS